MYPEYFGLKESSFSITPDPQYLYLSRQHREALAHLLYGTGDSGGFVLLTGEVGTGKTTVCRAFLEQLPAEVDVALILNPALSATELLHTVCQELGIQVPPGETSMALLLERLNGFLLDAHARGRRPVLLIDEAQNLKPEVLEQIRLLTNLETAKYKLLQIFLIGQPELRDLLQRPELRQLAQRITARYHLLPLNQAETGDYIRHRLAVAGVERRIFTPAALRRIFRLTDGLPRLINILCDRALLGGYATRSALIDAGIVNRAARELKGHPAPSAWRRWAAAAVVLILLGAVGAYAWREWPLPAPSSGDATTAPVAGEQRAANPEPAPAPTPASAQSSEAPAPTVASAMAPAPSSPATQPGPEPLAGLDELIMDRRTAMVLLFKTWGINLAPNFAGDPCDQAASHGLQCRNIRGTWNQLRHIDRPTLITLFRPGGASGQTLVTGLSTHRVSLVSNKAEARFELSKVEPYWYGEGLVLWKPPPGGVTLIGPMSPSDAVRWLRQTLAKIPGVQLKSVDSLEFDGEVAGAVKRFQTERGLTPDGLAGPETLMQLSAAAKLADQPRLTSSP